MIINDSFHFCLSDDHLISPFYFLQFGFAGFMGIENRCAFKDMGCILLLNSFVKKNKLEMGSSESVVDEYPIYDPIKDTSHPMSLGGNLT